MDEIIVTATKREQNIQDVPISILAFKEKILLLKGLVIFSHFLLRCLGFGCRRLDHFKEEYQYVVSGIHLVAHR